MALKRISNGVGAEGTYTIYVGARDGAVSFEGDVTIGRSTGRGYNYVRYDQRLRQRRGKALPPTRGKLRDELAIVLGPDMSPKDAITALTKITHQIQNEGLRIGEDVDQDPYFEAVGDD